MEDSGDAQGRFVMIPRSEQGHYVGMGETGNGLAQVETGVTQFVLLLNVGVFDDVDCTLSGRAAAQTRRLGQRDGFDEPGFFLGHQTQGIETSQ